MSAQPRGIRLHDTTPPTPIAGWSDQPSATDAALGLSYDDLAPARPGELIDAETGELLAPGSDLVVRESRLQGLEAAARDALDRSARGMRDLCLILGEHLDLAGEASQRTIELIESLGLQRSTGYHMAQIGQAARAHPALLDLAERKRSAVLALVQGLDDQALSDVVTGQAELTLDDVDRMSVRDLKRQLRRLREDAAKVVAEETKTLRSERDALREDLAAARAALDSDLAATRKTARQVREATETLSRTLDQLCDQIAALDPKDADRIREVIEGNVSMASTLLRDTWQRWQERALELGLDD